MIDYNKILSPAIVDMKPSGIRKFFDIAQQLEGVISLGVGEPDFKTPWVVRREAINVLEKGRTSYTANAGLAELRKEIARYFSDRIGVNYDPNDEIIVTVGGSEGIDLCIRSIVTAGDEVLIVQPSFVCYSPIVTLCGGVPVPIETKAENEFRLTAEELRSKITEKQNFWFCLSRIIPQVRSCAEKILKKLQKFFVIQMSLFSLMRYILSLHTAESTFQLRPFLG